MSTTVLKAARVREVLSSHARDSDKMAQLVDGAPANLEATRALVAGLSGVQWKVVLGCVRALARATAESADTAVAGLLVCLNHPYPEVRAAAGESLSALSALAEIPIEPLWDALLGEEEVGAYFSIGRALLRYLRSSGCSAPAAWSTRLHSLLSDVLELRLCELPLSGAIPERNDPTAAPPAPAPGLMARLMGQQAPYVPPLPDLPPRPVRMEKRQFLADLGDRYRDTPEVISLAAQIYAYLPGDIKPRLTLILQLCQMPLASFATSEALVLLAANLVRDTRDKMALLASMWGWGRSYEPTWTGRLALSAAQARPDLRLPLFQFLRARHSRIDWAGWANSLREATPIDLDPLVAATLAAPESDLSGWLRLLAQAPVEHIVPALARALGSPEREVAWEALERLLHYGQPVPSLLNDIQGLRQHWAADFAMLKGLETLMSKTPESAGPLPEGMREPDLVVEWTLEDSAANPFSRGMILPWREALRELNAFYIRGGDVHIITATAMVTLGQERPPVVRSLPDETAGAGMTLLSAGRRGELLFAGRGHSRIHLYLLADQARGFQRVEPGIPADEVPAPREVMSDGTHFGWSRIVEREGQVEGQVEGGLSLRKETTYRLDPETCTLQTVWTEEMRPLETAKIETSDPLLPPLVFYFSRCGGYRLCASLGLAIRSGSENPLHSQGCAEEKLALYLEVFPSRLCRVYLWHRE